VNRRELTGKVGIAKKRGVGNIVDVSIEMVRGSFSRSKKLMRGGFSAF